HVVNHTLTGEELEAGAGGDAVEIVVVETVSFVQARPSEDPMPIAYHMVYTERVVVVLKCLFGQGRVRVVIQELRGPGSPRVREVFEQPRATGLKSWEGILLQAVPPICVLFISSLTGLPSVLHLNGSWMKCPALRGSMRLEYGL